MHRTLAQGTRLRLSSGKTGATSNGIGKEKTMADKTADCDFEDGGCAHEWENTGLVQGSEYIFSCIFCSETATIGMWR
jgi:hypothetical protein